MATLKKLKKDYEFWSGAYASVACNAESKDNERLREQAEFSRALAVDAFNAYLDELKEQHSKLTISFEKEFSNIIKREGNIEKDTPIEESKTKSIPADESVKDIYKKAAKQLHPDKGGDEEEFKELNQRYKSNDLLGVIDLAVDRSPFICQSTFFQAIPHHRNVTYAL